MLNEVELLEELPYYRSLQKGGGGGGHRSGALRLEGYDDDETSIAIIAPDIRLPQHQLAAITSIDNRYEQYSSSGSLGVLLSILSYIGDVGTDLVVCYVLFTEGRVLWAALMASFVVLAAITLNALSMFWYVQNHKNISSYETPSTLSKIVRTLCHLLLLGQLYRYAHVLCTNCMRKRREAKEESDQHRRSVSEARKRKSALHQMTIKEGKEGAMLSLLHSLLESAPQLVLQLYTLAQRTESDDLAILLIQGSCAGSSLFQMAWSITYYNGILHRTTSGKEKSTNSGMMMQFLWHFCTIGSRACTLALFTKEYNFWLFPFCIGHWGIMTVWVMHQQTNFCRKDGKPQQCREYMFTMIIGAAYVIYYLNVKAEPTRYKYSAYYAIVFAENCALMTLWFFRNDPGVWYHIPALVTVFSSFATGIVFMLFYYGFCHPTGKQKNEKRAARCC